MHDRFVKVKWGPRKTDLLRFCHCFFFLYTLIFRLIQGLGMDFLNYKRDSIIWQFSVCNQRKRKLQETGIPESHS